MSENNSNNDYKQENQHQSNFILLAVNSGNLTGLKESGKAGDSPEEPAEKVVGKQNMQNLPQRFSTSSS